MQPRASTGGRVLVVLVLLILVPALAGCFSLYKAHVPARLLTDGWEEVETGGGGSWLGDGARWSHVTYQVEPAGDSLSGRGPYPAYLTVLSIDTVMQLGREKVSRDLDEQIRLDAEQQDVAVDEGSRRSGERELASGVRTIWFTYRGEAEGGGGLFRSGNEVRIIGEVWPDERSRMTVVTVGLAQTQGGTVTTYTDTTHWHKIVMDPQAAIAAPAGDEGLIYNVRSHGS